MRAPHRLGAVLVAVGLTTLAQAAPSTPSARPGTAQVRTAAAGVPRCEGKPATIVGTSRADHIEGTPGPDVIVGRNGSDRIDGRGGADVICGGPGADRIDGGGRHDRLYGGRDERRVGPGGSYLVGDQLLGGPGRDLLDGGADPRKADQRRRPDTYSWADADQRVTVDLSGAGGVGTAKGRGHDTITVGAASGIVGSAHADRITGSPGPDRVQAGAGNDHVVTGRGRDLVFPDRGRDDRGRDLVATGKGDDLVSSLGGRDEIATGGGTDFVEAFSEAPTVVRTGPGADYVGQYVAPGSGAAADGGGGNDVITFYGRLLANRQPAPGFVVDYRTGTTGSTDGAATGTIKGFEGHRFIGRLAWKFFGSGGNDRVWAIDGGPLVARGRGGDDSFTGTPGRDLLAGGSGTDYAAGGGGKDRCRSIERGDC